MRPPPTLSPLGKPDAIRQRPHLPRRPLDHILSGYAVTLDLRRLESLRHFVAVQAGSAPIIVEALARVLREVRCSDPRLVERPRALRQVADQLDVHDPATPHVPDQPLRYEASDREMDMQPVAARMPLRCPRIRQRRAAQLATQPAEEPRHIAAQLPRITAALGIGQRPEPVQPIGSAVAPHLRPRPPPRLLLRPRRISGTRAPSIRDTRPDKTAATLRRVRIQRERPASLHSHDHLRVQMTLDSKAPWAGSRSSFAPRLGVSPPSHRCRQPRSQCVGRRVGTLQPPADGAPHGEPQLTPRRLHPAFTGRCGAHPALAPLRSAAARPEPGASPPWPPSEFRCRYK